MLNWIFGHIINRYDTFSGLSPQVVKKMPRKDLAEEVMIASDWVRLYRTLYRRRFSSQYVTCQVWRLQAALEEQADRTKYQQEEFNRLQNV